MPEIRNPTWEKVKLLVPYQKGCLQLHCKGTKTFPSEKLVTCNDERRWESRVKLVRILSSKILAQKLKKPKLYLVMMANWKKLSK